MSRHHSLPIRMNGYPVTTPPPLVSGISLETLKAHPDYRAAKSGSAAAAWTLVTDLVPEAALVEAARTFGPRCIFTPALALESTGHNRIPDALARLFADATGGRVCHEIVQANLVHHTGADFMERMIARPLFDGDVEAGGRYVLVDDVSTIGSTLAEMADHVIAHGGFVAGSTLLVNSSRSGLLAPRRASTTVIEQRFGDVVRNEFMVSPMALTYDEAFYLAGFRDREQLCQRIQRAHADTESRMASKQRPVEAGTAQCAVQERRDRARVLRETRDADLMTSPG